MSIKIEVSVGELLDKITILQIKSERIEDKTKLSNINKELTVLSEQWNGSVFASIDLDSELSQLKKVNEKLWDIEDDIREKERNAAFDKNFIELARMVYFTNDERSRIKHNINEKTGSALIEEKSYSEYTN